MPSRGRLGFFCQSGALGTTILGMVHDRGLGLSTFVSAGNRADVSANDLLQYWRDDDATDLVLLYLESIGNPRKFARIARHLARRKPIVAVRSGRTSQALPLGHTVRRTSLPPAAIDALFAPERGDPDRRPRPAARRRLDPRVPAAAARVPRGRRRQLRRPGGARRRRLRGGRASRSWVRRSTCRRTSPPTPAGARSLPAAADPVVDALLVLHVPPLRSDVSAYRDMIVATSARLTVPVVAVLVGPEDQGALIAAPGAHGEAGPGSVPVFSTVEAAVRALGSVVRYAEWRHRVPGEVPDLPDVATDEARDLVEGLLDGLGDGDEVEPTAADTARAAGGLRHRPVAVLPRRRRRRRGRRRPDRRLPGRAQDDGAVAGAPHRPRRGAAEHRERRRDAVHLPVDDRAAAAGGRGQPRRAAHGPARCGLRRPFGGGPPVRSRRVLRGRRCGDRAARGPRLPHPADQRHRRPRPGQGAGGLAAAARSPRGRPRRHRRARGPAACVSAGSPTTCRRWRSWRSTRSSWDRTGWRSCPPGSGWPSRVRARTPVCVVASPPRRDRRRETAAP